MRPKIFRATPLTPRPAPVIRWGHTTENGDRDMANIKAVAETLVSEIDTLSMHRPPVAAQIEWLHNLAIPAARLIACDYVKGTGEVKADMEWALKTVRLGASLPYDATADDMLAAMREMGH